MDEEAYVTERRPDIWLKSLLASLVKDKVEWKEIMGAVRNQGRHDSCWAVVVSELIMAILRIRDDPSITLSPQDLLDFCAERTESLSKPGHFCYPFPFPGAFNYVKENGIQKEQHRPYIGCSRVVPSRYRDPMQCAYIKDFLSLGSIERAVRQFRHQPVGAHLAMFYPDILQNHKEIYRGPATVTSNFEALHAVTLIDGGTTEEGENYVVARLSNGPKWGDNGYVKVSVSTWIKLKNPDRTSAKETAKMFFSTARQLLFNFVCPTLLSPDEENTKRKRRKRALEFVNIFKNKRRKLSQT